MRNLGYDPILHSYAPTPTNPRIKWGKNAASHLLERFPEDLTLTNFSRNEHEPIRKPRTTPGNTQRRQGSKEPARVLRDRPGHRDSPRRPLLSAAVRLLQLHDGSPGVPLVLTRETIPAFQKAFPGFEGAEFIIHYAPFDIGVLMPRWGSRSRLTRYSTRALPARS